MGFRYFAACLWATAAFIILASFPLRLFYGWEVPVVGIMFHRQELASNVTPVIILILFIWTLAELVLRARAVHLEHTSVLAFREHLPVLGVKLLPEAQPTFSRLRGHKRAGLVVKAQASDPKALHELLPATAALDAQALGAAYGALQVYAWVLPVLGFIGTALGMAKAIVGFRQAMLEAANTDKILEDLANSVIPGLAAAFSTTILALAASLVVYLCATALRAWDQEALDELNELSVQYLLLVPSSDHKIAGALDEISGRLDRLNDAATALETAAASVHASSEALTKASSKLDASSTELHAAASQPFIITRGRVV